jgi:uncharacterized protein YjiS (DUF1127 family)
MNQRPRFHVADAGLSPVFQPPAELQHNTGARQERAAATAAMLAAAFRGTARGLRLLRTRVARWKRRRATRATLMGCSDRVLADIGIERADIPLVAKGIDPAEYQLRDSALHRWWNAARVRVRAVGAAWRERRLLYRELDAYTDRELEEIGLRRADIPAVARGEPVLRRAA